MPELNRKEIYIRIKPETLDGFIYMLDDTIALLTNLQEEALHELEIRRKDAEFAKYLRTGAFDD